MRKLRLVRCRKAFCLTVKRFLSFMAAAYEDKVSNANFVAVPRP